MYGRQVSYSEMLDGRVRTPAMARSFVNTVDHAFTVASAKE
jgi:hypothetical protein